MISSAIDWANEKGEYADLRPKRTSQPNQAALPKKDNPQIAEDEMNVVNVVVRLAVALLSEIRSIERVGQVVETKERSD